MAVDEHSFGPFFVTKTNANRRWVPFHTVELVEMVEPWRTGKALAFPIGRYMAGVIGVWLYSIDDVVENDEFFNERWLSPKWLPTSVEEISEWGIDEEEETQADP
jgi:hypothetical protein